MIQIKSALLSPIQNLTTTEVGFLAICGSLLIASITCATTIYMGRKAIRNSLQIHISGNEISDERNFAGKISKFEESMKLTLKDLQEHISLICEALCASTEEEAWSIYFGAKAKLVTSFILLNQHTSGYFTLIHSAHTVERDRIGATRAKTLRKVGNIFVIAWALTLSTPLILHISISSSLVIFTIGMFIWISLFKITIGWLNPQLLIMKENQDGHNFIVQDFFKLPPAIHNPERNFEEQFVKTESFISSKFKSNNNSFFIKKIFTKKESIPKINPLEKVILDIWISKSLIIHKEMNMTTLRYHAHLTSIRSIKYLAKIQNSNQGINLIAMLSVGMESGKTLGLKILQKITSQQLRQVASSINLAKEHIKIAQSKAVALQKNQHEYAGMFCADKHHGNEIGSEITELRCAAQHIVELRAHKPKILALEFFQIGYNDMHWPQYLKQSFFTGKSSEPLSVEEFLAQCEKQYKNIEFLKAIEKYSQIFNMGKSIYNQKGEIVIEVFARTLLWVGGLNWLRQSGCDRIIGLDIKSPYSDGIGRLASTNPVWAELLAVEAFQKSSLNGKVVKTIRWAMVAGREHWRHSDEGGYSLNVNMPKTCHCDLQEILPQSLSKHGLDISVLLIDLSISSKATQLNGLAQQ